VSCHCGLPTALDDYFHSIYFPRSAFPLKSALCHCNSCRHVSGQLFVTFAVIPAAKPGEDVLSGDHDGDGPGKMGLTRYASSGTMTRWFCGRCGASVVNVEEGEWEVATGCLSFEDGPGLRHGLEGSLQRAQIWVDDVSADGGAAAWVNGGKAEGMKRYLKGRGGEEVCDETVERMVEEGRRRTHAVETQRKNKDVVERGKELQAFCHCRSVRFTIARPRDESKKYQACLDACTSCRTVSGFEITSWVTVPQSSISLPDGGKLDLSKMAGLRKYKTSENVSRYFCKTCGATVFYLKDQLDTIDVGVGLLDAEEGAIAESWLEWDEYPACVAYPDDAVDQEFVTKLAEGIRDGRHQG